MNMEKTNLTFEKIVLILKKGFLWILIAGTVLGCVAAIYGQFFIRDEYTSRLLMRIDTKDASSTVIAKLDYHVADMVRILDTRFVAERAVEQAGIKIGGETAPAVAVMRQGTSIVGNAKNGSITISVTSTNPEASFKLIRAYSDLLPSIVEEKGLQPIDILELPEEMPLSPSNGGRAVEYALLGGVAGILIACVVLVVRAMFDVIIRTQEDLQEVVDFPVLGQIPHYNTPVASEESADAVFK